jgi:peptidyl-prolyl cis-trans isomerase NIMA-interacting 1
MRAHVEERLARAAPVPAPASRGSAAGERAWQPRRAFLLSAGFIAWLGCAEFTSPPAARAGAEGGAASQPVAAPPPSGAAPTPPGGAAPTRAVAERTPPEAAAETPTQIEASHILVSYQGATRAKPTVTRTRDEARALATQLATRAHEPGSDFAALAKDVSDGPSGVEGGALPKFGRQQMVKPFSDAAFALQPGEISGVIETNFGFHVIQRTR